MTRHLGERSDGTWRGTRGIPLRVGLVAATVLLAALGLLASGVAVTSIMQHSLINRVDETLLEASRS